MVEGLKPGLLIGAIALLALSGCASAPPDNGQTGFMPEQVEPAPQTESPVAPSPLKPSVKASPKELATVRRAISEKEVRKLVVKDPDLDFYRCIEILSRLNRKDKEYIRQDMKRKRPLIVPKNFSVYKDWSPLPSNISGAGKLPKLIVVVKDLHFLGWYQNGRLVGDTYVCIGKMKNWTKKGMYNVQDKDPNHMSTYPNAYGESATMPDALHIYERVWIHTGDVIGPNCSHGCINVPIAYSEKLYNWADVGTAVLITESLKDLNRDIKTSRLAKSPEKIPPLRKVKVEEVERRTEDKGQKTGGAGQQGSASVMQKPL